MVAEITLSTLDLYGPAFAEAVKTLQGDVRLETEPGGPLAIIQEKPGFVGRIVLSYC